MNLQGYGQEIENVLANELSNTVSGPQRKFFIQLQFQYTASSDLFLIYEIFTLESTLMFTLFTVRS